MKKCLYLFVFLIYVSFSSLYAQSWTPQYGSVKFKIKNSGFNVDGTLTGMQATINFDPADLSNSTISASVNAESINTSNDMRDKHLRSADYFDASNYPSIKMVSNSFKKTETDKYIGSFQVTIKGNTKTIDIPFSFKVNGNDDASFYGEFSIDRLDFGVGEKSIILDNDVKVQVSMTVKK